MVRKVTFVVQPTPTLGALLSFAQATRTHRSGLGDRLEREVRLALESAARTLDPLLALMRWLARRGLARSTGYVDATGLAVETTVTIDLRAAVTAALAPGSRVDGRAYTDLYSMRSLVRSLRKVELLSLTGVVLGRQADTPRSLLRVIEEACRGTALRDEALVPKAFARVVPSTEPTKVPPKTPAPAPSPPSKQAGASTSGADPGSGGGSLGGSFGGLPDDATSPPIAPETPLSDRGLTLDAEFFLMSARLKSWPCSAKVLTHARRAVLIELHPDRAGEGTEAIFRSALKGFEDLARVLSELPTPARPAKPTPRPPSSGEVTIAPSASSGQWPPPPPPPPPPPVVPGAPLARSQSFKRSSKA